MWTDYAVICCTGLSEQTRCMRHAHKTAHQLPASLQIHGQSQIFLPRHWENHLVFLTPILRLSIGNSPPPNSAPQTAIVIRIQTTRWVPLLLTKQQALSLALTWLQSPQRQRPGTQWCFSARLAHNLSFYHSCPVPLPLLGHGGKSSLEKKLSIFSSSRLGARPCAFSACCSYPVAITIITYLSRFSLGQISTVNPNASEALTS